MKYSYIRFLYYLFIRDNYNLKSLVYDIEEFYIKHVSSNTSIELYSKYFDMDKCSIKVFDLNNEEIVSGYVINGSITIVYNNNYNFNCKINKKVIK